MRTAVHMWPGSEATIGTYQPTYLDRYKSREPLQKKVERILGWLDIPGLKEEGAEVGRERPQFIAAYVPDVDRDGHEFGPNSTSIRSTIADVDGMVGSLLRGLEERNLSDVVNVVVVSDHGMATTSEDRIIQLEDLVDPALVEHTDGWYVLRAETRVNPSLLLLASGLFPGS